MIGTIRLPRFPTDATTPPRAILQSTAANKTHIVSSGENLDASTEVISIESKQRGLTPTINSGNCDCLSGIETPTHKSSPTRDLCRVCKHISAQAFAHVKVLCSLTATGGEREVIRLRYGFEDGIELSLRAVGKRLGKSHEWVSKVEKTGLAKMHKHAK